MVEITISVDRGDHAEALDPNELLQVHAYDQVRGYLATSARDARKVMSIGTGAIDSGHDEELPRVHDAIFIEGGRGTGKTAFILNLKSHLGSVDGARIHYCSPIDPTLLNKDESFLNVVIAKLHDEMKRNTSSSDRHGRHHEPDRKATYFEALEAVSHAMEALDGKDQAAGMDRILTHRNGLGLQRHLFRYYREVCKALNCDLLVLPIDDADMAPQWAFEILDVIRRYLACPLIVPVVTGDIRQYKHIVARDFSDKLNKGADDKYQQIADLAEQYLNKVLPVHRRLHLLTVPELVEQHMLLIKEGGRLIRFPVFLAFFRHFVFRRTNREHADLLPGTTRGLIQWLLATARPILGVPGVSDIKADDPEELERQARDLAWKQRESQDAGDRARFREIISAINTYWASAGRWTDYHRGIADLRLATDRLDERPQQPLHDLIWFNALRHPKEQGTYDWEKVVKEVFAQARITGADTSQLPRTLTSFPGLEPYSVDAIFPKRDMAGLQTPAARFLARVFSYDNYYSSYQTTNLVFFGRAFEIVATSLFGVYDRKMLARVLRDAPYHSYFEAFLSKNLDVGPDDNEPFADEGNKPDDFLTDFVARLDEWHKDHVGARPSAQLVQRSMNKAFNMLIQLKLRGVLTGDTLADVTERFRRILLNAFGSFEKSVLEGDRIIVRQNVALERRTQGARLAEWEKDPSYRFNVEPLLKRGSVTYAISRHPLFALVEAAGEEAKLLVVGVTSGIAVPASHSRHASSGDRSKKSFKPGAFIGGFVKRKMDLTMATFGQANEEDQNYLRSIMKEISMHSEAKQIKKYILGSYERGVFSKSMVVLGDAFRNQQMLDEFMSWLRS